MDTLEELCLHVVGKQAWGLTRTFGSALIIEFGDKLPRKNSRKDHGETHLLIQGGSWRLVTKQSVVVGSDDESDAIDQVFRDILLGSVEQMSINKATLDISICLAGITLETFTTGAGKSAEDAWILYRGESDAWAVQPGPTLTRYHE